MTDELTKSLSKAQGEMDNPPLDAENSYYNSKYSTLGATRDAIIPSLSKNGIALVFTTEIREGGVALIGRLMHSSGQALTAEWPITIGKPHDMAAQMTYGKRQLAQALAFVCGEEDDDGNAAQDAATVNEKTASGRPTPSAVAAKQRQRKEAAEVENEEWTGPLKKSALKEKLRELVGDIEACEDLDSFIALQSSDEFKALTQQCEVDVPSWWNDSSDRVGLANRIANKKAELENKEMDGTRSARVSDAAAKIVARAKAQKAEEEEEESPMFKHALNRTDGSVDQLSDASSWISALKNAVEEDADTWQINVQYANELSKLYPKRADDIAAIREMAEN